MKTRRCPLDLGTRRSFVSLTKLLGWSKEAERSD